MTEERREATLEDFVNMVKRGSEIDAGDGIYSFIPLMKKHLQLRRPKRIVEWGSGMSTVLMASELPESEIVTFESDMDWFLYWARQFRDFRNIKMYPLKVEANYVEAPLGMGKFDMAFVDGVDATRAACIEVAAKVLNPGGCLIVHDTERQEYWPSINRYFKVVDESERKWNSHTVVLELKKNE
jgi:predicted O-methyltransferase YrrM